MQFVSDLKYSEAFALDAYLSDDSVGAILLLHGGWLNGDKNKERILAERLCNAGFHVFAANFGLDGTGTNGGALADAIAALHWIGASDFKIDRGRLAVMGCGTGGTVAIEVGLRTGLPVVAWSALIDFKGFMDSTATLGDSDHLRDFDGVSLESICEAGEQVPFLRGVILALVANNLSLLASTSPLSRATSSAGEMLLFNSMHEVVSPKGATLMQDALTKCNVACTVNLLDGAAHGSEYLLKALPASIKFLRAACSDESARAKDGRDEQEEYLTEALLETFPASDPISPGHVTH